MPRMYKDILQINNKWENDLMQTSDKDWNRYFSRKEIQMPICRRKVIFVCLFSRGMGNKPTVKYQYFTPVRY